MKLLVISILFMLNVLTSFAQESKDSILKSEVLVLIYVTNNKKILLNGEKSNFRKVEKYLLDRNIKKAKIGTVKPTPIDVAAVFIKVEKLMEKYNIETVWYRDPNFSTLFFDK